MLPGCVPWPPEEAARHRADGYWDDRPLGELLRRSAAEHGDRTAVVGGGLRLSYAELDARADDLARGLLEIGVTGGDRIVVHLPNCPEFVVATFALLRIGALPVYALPAHRLQEVGHLCAFSGARGYLIADRYLGHDYRETARTLAARPGVELSHILVVGDAQEFTAFDAVEAAGRARRGLPLPPDGPADDVALFLLSGGTTGLPKLIPRTHNDYGYNARAAAEVCGFDRETVYLAALPAAHNFALACPGVLGALAVGGTVVLPADPSPDESLRLISEERVTATALVPSLLGLWLDALEWLPEDVSSLRLVQVGGAKPDAATAARVRPVLGCALQQVFGMAEGLLNLTRLDDPEELVLATQGRPLSAADEVRIVDDEGHDVPRGAVGQLLTRGPYTLRGYYRLPEHNARAFSDGWYRTGDLVRALPSGHLAVEGRIKEVINRAGDKVSAEEIEEQLTAHPAVRQAAVVGEPDPVLGERIAAFVVVEPGLGCPTSAEAGEFLRARGLAPYKVPDRLTPVGSLPLTAIGKVDRKALLDGASTARTAHDPPDTPSQGNRPRPGRPRW
ncbi:(2,3-dihydroxybenzoyl)adenylate synthase [Streptomyces sp. CBMA29]|uniref:(2,3-dihydroxybenzoyl)adenylate synthase n=1 Tax=Streptomyces sp. CBMA29 TaxID=1896314 RepID=UPI001661CF2F|nr:AMP-binding protein [Streptomyces sp. CBMA29]MBD0740658.1 2,3-dihydroxybenzoate-AMP ligase [Streptomyces sp. CBMA29]